MATASESRIVGQVHQPKNRERIEYVVRHEADGGNDDCGPQRDKPPQLAERKPTPVVLLQQRMGQRVEHRRARHTSARNRRRN